MPTLCSAQVPAKAHQEDLLAPDDLPVVLIVDDEHKSLACLPRLITSNVFAPIWVPNEQQGLHLLRTQAVRIRLIIVDQKSSGLGGAGFMQVARQIVPEVNALITTPLGPVLYHGHAAYELQKANLKEDINTILRAVAEKIGLAPATPNNQTLQARRSSFGHIIGRSWEMNRIYDLIQTIENSTATVLIQGESGTGKELIAQTIHQMSPRRKKQFVPVNCGAIPANLVESELYGHEKGAFTSACKQHKGKFEQAHGGTLFLDEIGELEPDVQIKLLRVLQEKEFQRVGGNTTHKADCRLISATSRNLSHDVASGRFREDLFYRIKVIPIHVPPLRHRRQDIPLLLEHFFMSLSRNLGRTPPRLSEDVAEVLHNYPYPGNIRELINLVERLCVTCPEPVIQLKDLPEEIRDHSRSPSRPQGVLKDLPESGITLQDMERELILKTLRLTSGNKVAAARKLGITRRLLYLRLQKYGLCSQSYDTSGDSCRTGCSLK